MESLLNQYRRQPGQDGLSDVDGEFHVKQMLRGCVPNPEIDMMLGMSDTQAILLYGEAGSGKSTLAQALAHEIAETGCDFLFVKLPAWGLLGDTDKESCSYICRLFEELSEASASVLVIIEDIVPICRKPSAAWMLSECIDHLLQQAASCTIVLTVNDMTLVPECLLKVVVPCKVEKPDLEARRKYFAKTLPETVRCEYGLTPQVMAQMTYGFGYSQLRQCIRMILLRIKQEMTVFGGVKSLTRQGFEAVAENLRQAGIDARGLTASSPDAAASLAGAGQTLAGGSDIETEYDLHTMRESMDLDEELPDLDDLPAELGEWEV